MSMLAQAGRTGLAVIDAAWRHKNHTEPRLLVYTDSRGLNLAGRFKKHFGSHVERLQRRFCVDIQVCPHSHTTLVDFLAFLDAQDRHRYDAIVLQCGVVDFSPRPRSSIDKIKAAKHDEPRFGELFAMNADYHRTAFPQEYEGESTITLYSPAYLRRLVLELETIDNLIWVSSNNFVPGWDGNWRERPQNIDPVVMSFDRVMLDQLPHTVDLHDWSNDEVQRFTLDNVHFTDAGFANVSSRIEQAIVAVIENRRQRDG